MATPTGFKKACGFNMGDPSNTADRQELRSGTLFGVAASMALAERNKNALNLYGLRPWCSMRNARRRDIGYSFEKLGPL